MADPKSEAEAVAEIVKTAAAPVMLQVQRGDEAMAGVLVAPHDMRVHSLKAYVDAYLPNPERRRGTASFQELGSFIAHANRFKAPESAVFAEPSPQAPKLTTVLDYHLAGADEDRIKARHGEHRGVYHFPLADEWKTWRGADAKTMNQAQFAEFIEANILDVVDPASAGDGAKLFALNTGCTFASPAALMTLSRGLAVTVDSKVTNAVNLATGEGQLSYAEEHRDAGGQSLKVPGALLIAVPVFRSGFAYQIPVRLRYRVKDGNVTWTLAMYRPERYFDDAFMGACERVREETALPLFVGSPEV